MSKRANWGLEKTKMRMNAANVKPERPRWDEQMRLEKSLGEIQDQSSSRSKKIQEDMFNELGNKWKGQKGGSSGDAFVTGLTAGIKEGSFMDDKKRSQQLAKFTEQMRDLVADQNVKLFEAEKLHNAKASMAPRIMAYMDRYKTMSPNDRKVYLQNALEEFNQAAGTDYKLIDTNGAEPWKIMVSDGEGIVQEDLMNFIQTPEEQKLKYYLDSPEVKNYEASLANEDAIESESLREKSLYNKSRFEDAEIKRKEHQDALQIEKDILENTGDHVKFIDNLPTSLRTNAEARIKEYTEKANQHLAAEKRLHRAIQIAEEHPELFGNLNAIISSRYNENPGYLNNLLKNKIPPKSRDAMSELAGIVKNIFTDSVKGVPAKGINRFIEQKLEAGSPNQRWTASAFKKVVQEAEKESAKEYNEYKKGSDYGSQGLIYRPRAKSREETPKEMQPKEMQPAQEAIIFEKLKSIPGLTREDIDEVERRLKSGQ